MKKIFSVIICIVLLFCLCSCTAVDNNKELKQEMTIVKMPSPPKCKTTDSVNAINEILSLFKDIEKSPLDEDVKGWSVMIKLDVDGKSFNFTISETLFTDSDGTQYSVDGTDAICKILEIYEKLDSPEKDYP